MFNYNISRTILSTCNLNAYVNKIMRLTNSSGADQRG